MKKPLLWLPFILAFVFMLPRMVDARFGFLDDAVTLLFGRQLTANVPLSLLKAFTAIGDTGRFIPAYWLYYAFIYWLGWDNAFLFYAANTVALLLITGGIVFFVRYRGGSYVQAALAASLFVFSGPVLESFYTGSQEGPPQLVFLCLVFVCLAAYARANTRGQEILAAAGMFACLLGANCTMETSVVMAGIAAAWFITAKLRLAGKGDQLTSGSLMAMTITGSLAVAAWFFLRMRLLHLPVTGGTYTSGYVLDFKRVLVTGSGYLAYFVRDFSYLIPLFVPVVARARRGEQGQTRVILDSLAWIAAWTLIYLPWQSALEYYLLPCTLGFAVLGGIAGGQLLEELQQKPGDLRLKLLGCGAVALVILGCVNNATNGRYQMTMDRSNNSLLDYLATLPPNSKVLVNIPEPNEYEYEIGLHLAETRRRPDVIVDYFRYQTPAPEQQATTYYVAAPQVLNEPHPSLRYALYGNGTGQWNRSLADFMGRDDRSVFRVENQMQLLDFGLERFVCLLTRSRAGLYCEVPRPFIDGRRLSFGWDVYRVSRKTVNLSQPGMFLDGGEWVLRNASGAIRRIRFGEPGDRPLTGDWLGQGHSGIGVFRPGNKTWYLDADLDGKPDVVFHADNMRAGDIPVTGDWDGRGKSTPAYFRPEDATWHFLHDFKDPKEDLVLTFGAPGDLPLAGDWDGDGKDTIGLYRRTTGEVIFQNLLAQSTEIHVTAVKAGASMVAADWSGSGKSVWRL